MAKKFDRLYKTIMEEVKSSKKTVIKESVSIQEKMDAIRVAADIIKRAMAVNKDEVLEELERDVNYDSSCCAFEDYNGKGITREMWENSIKYGWMAETLPYFIDWQDYLFENVEITPEERAILEKADNNAYVFSDEFEKGNLEGLDFCKEICSQFDVDIDPEELMIYFAGEDDDMDYESVKKPVSKRRVIKEHRAHRPLRCRQVIKESARRHAKRHLIKEDYENDDQVITNWQAEQKWIIERLQKYIGENDSNEVGNDWDLKEWAQKLIKTFNNGKYDNRYDADQQIESQVLMKIEDANEDLVITKDNYKDEIKSAINSPAVAERSMKCNKIIDSLTFEEAKKLVEIMECEDGFDDIDWYLFKNDAKAIMKKYSSWCDQWKKDNQENVDYYNNWRNEELDEDDQPETMDYGWITDDRILRGAYSFYYMIADALNEDVITDKLDALVLYGYLQMYWNSIDEPDYDDGIACCGVDLD